MQIKGPVITPLIELAKAECDVRAPDKQILAGFDCCCCCCQVAKAKSTLFDVPLSGPSRVSANSNILSCRVLAIEFRLIALYIVSITVVAVLG